jgi:hypothetical protein
VVNPHLERLARHRGCTADPALQFCLDVQTLQPAQSAFRVIAFVACQSDPKASPQEVAQKIPGTALPFPGQRTSRPRGRPWQASSPPRYMIVDGVVESTSGWQKRERISDDK